VVRAVAAASNPPSMTTQWKCRCGLSVEPERRSEARRGPAGPSYRNAGRSAPRRIVRQR
jgi:hypothetical protein